MGYVGDWWCLLDTTGQRAVCALEALLVGTGGARVLFRVLVRVLFLVLVKVLVRMLCYSRFRVTSPLRELVRVLFAALRTQDKELYTLSAPKAP